MPRGSITEGKRQVISLNPALGARPVTANLRITVMQAPVLTNASERMVDEARDLVRAWRADLIEAVAASGLCPAICAGAKERPTRIVRAIPARHVGCKRDRLILRSGAGSRGPSRPGRRPLSGAR